MTIISKRLEQVVRNTISRAPIIPTKTPDGILVGSVLIKSNGSLKNLWKNGQLVFAGVNLNVAAVKLANELAKYSVTLRSTELYNTDQEYGRWLTDSQIHYKNHQRALARSQFEKADMIWARYCESKKRCEESKKRVERLSIL